jgi:peptide/nickel transport system ATP-binding protein
MDAPLLEISGLTVAYPMGGRDVPVIDGVELTVRRGEIVGVVGESGSGKTITAYSIVRLLEAPGRITGGSIRFDGADLAAVPEEAMRDIRGRRIAMVLQDPTATLNPVLTIGAQMAEAITCHAAADARAVRKRCVEALKRVGIANPEERLQAYPHELSGGMRQRVAIATAMLNGPDLLIADEPTTALDVTIQAQILHEVQRLLAASGASALWISHDLSVVSSIADVIAVMYAGRVVEEGPCDQVIAAPAHPYTRGLLDAFPEVGAQGERLKQIPGSVGSPAARPGGCSFRPRCGRATRACEGEPERREIRPGQFVRCFHPLAPGDVA